MIKNINALVCDVNYRNFSVSNSTVLFKNSTAECSYNIRFLHGSTNVNEAKSKLKPKFYMFKNVTKVLQFNYEVLKPKNKNLLKIPNQKHPTLKSIKRLIGT